jgi:hypothetical protein
MRRFVVIASVALSLVIACGGGDGPSPPASDSTATETTTTFTPPEDGKVTPAQAEAFAQVAVALQEVGASGRGDQRAFFARHGLDEEARVRIVADETFAAEHPDLVREYNEIEQAWRLRLSAVFDSVGMTPEEFSWVGEALQTAVNSEAANLAANLLIGESNP